MISSNCTSYLQSLDIAVNRSFKSHLSKLIEEYIVDSSNYLANGKLKKMSIEQTTNWVKCASQLITKKTIVNACIAGGLPVNDEIDIGKSFIANHSRLKDAFWKEWDDAHANISREEFLKVDRQYKEDATFHVNLGNNGEVEESERVLRGSKVTKENIYKKQCIEAATDIVDEADENELADYSCCYCEVEMLTNQWHECKMCKQHCHGNGIGCSNQAGICKNCQTELFIFHLFILNLVTVSYLQQSPISNKTECKNCQ